MALSNAQFDEIMHEYEERRALHRQELEERQRYVYDTVPGYKELEDKTATASVDFGRRLLSGERLDKSALKRELEELARQKKTLLTEAGFSDDYLDMGYTCSDCKDTGYIGNEKCHCFKQKIIETLYDRSNLKTLAKTANFKLLTDKYYQGEDLKRFQGAVKASEKFINNKQELKSIYDDIYNCELLIIDDLGTERTNSFVASELFSCLNERDLRKKSTVITTNLSLEELQATYSERIFSRVTSNYTLLKLTGQDIRKIKKIARKESEDFQ